MNGDVNFSFGPRPPVFIMNAQELAKLNLSAEDVQKLLSLQIDLAERIFELQVNYIREVREAMGLKKLY